MRLPTFIVIGAMKSGTTSLYHYLRAQSDVFMATPKELNFFFDVELGTWDRGVEWYAEHFRTAGDARAVGEASPGYTRYPAIQGVPARMASIVPNARLVYLVRHPIERMCSHYRQNLEYHDERDPIGRALLENPHYLNCSRYATQLEQFTDHFPREQILVVTSERLRNQRTETVNGILRFVGVDPALSTRAVAQEFHQGMGNRTRGPIGRAIRRMPGRSTLGRLAPPSAKTVYRRLTTRPLPIEYTRLSAQEYDHVASLLAADIERLRSWISDAVDDWDFVPSEASPG